MNNVCEKMCKNKLHIIFVHSQVMKRVKTLEIAHKGPNYFLFNFFVCFHREVQGLPQPPMLICSPLDHAVILCHDCSVKLLREFLFRLTFSRAAALWFVSRWEIFLGSSLQVVHDAVFSHSEVRKSVSISRKNIIIRFSRVRCIFPEFGVLIFHRTWKN